MMNTATMMMPIRTLMSFRKPKLSGTCMFSQVSSSSLRSFLPTSLPIQPQNTMRELPQKPKPTASVLRIFFVKGCAIAGNTTMLMPSMTEPIAMAVQPLMPMMSRTIAMVPAKLNIM